MKKQLIFLLLISYQNIVSQIYQHFIFVNDIPMQYDMPLQITAERGIRDFYLENLDSAVFYYNKLLLLKPSYYQAHYNLARVYAKKKDLKNTKLSLEKYIEFSKENCKCSFLGIKDFDAINDTLFQKYKIICCNQFDWYVKENKLTNPQLLFKLEEIDGKEQEILGNSENREKQKTMLKANFQEFCQLIDTTNFPTEQEVGRGIGLIQLVILHLDYYPSIQYNLGYKLLNQSERGYSKKMAAYIIDRALRNLGKPQLYGTILNKNDNGQTERTLYFYDDLEKVKARREILGFQSIEDYLKNLSITK
ncbi:MAG: hypothetical protein ACK504_06665 [Bacteroidota bacterium]